MKVSMKVNRYRQPLVCALLVLPLVGLLAAPSSGASNAASSSSSTSYNPNGVLNFALDLSVPPAFDPTKETLDDTGNVLGQLLYDSLLRQQPNGSLTPELATVATIVDPQTITIKLRPGVDFQDGTPLNAAAVKFTILRNAASASAAFPAPIHDVSSIDLNGNLGLTLHLSQPEAGAFFPLLTDMSTMPVSPAAVARNNPDPVANPLGAGPFRVKQYVPNQSLQLVKSKTYWNAKNIKLGGIDFVNESSSTPAPINALRSAQVDAISSNITQLGALKYGDIKTSLTSSTTSKLYFPLCDTKGPLANVKVRQALSYGLDRKAINQALVQGKGELAWGLVPSSSNLFPADLDNYYAYNPAKAKKLLAQAGYAKGLSLTMAPGVSTDLQQLAEIAQQDWKKIGVTLQLSTVPPATYVQDVFVNHLYNLTDADVVRSGLDAISFIYTPGHLGDLCNYDNPALDAMVTQMSGLAQNDPQYIALWKKAQEYIVKNALAVWAVWLPTVVAYNSNHVGGIQTVFPGVTAYPDFFTAYVKK
jgi:peptide/nickel transport system substrate-binding protein